jgi:nucleoside-diphosphate-sugar epimerase
MNVEIVYGDVTDPESLPPAVAGKSIVYHVAGCIRALRRRRLFEVNQEGCRHVARTCALQPRPPVLVVVSSLAAAGPSSGDKLRTEDEPPCPVSDYGRSKRAAEQTVQEFADRVPITVVRPAIVLGEADAISLALFRPIARVGLHFAVGWRPHRFSVIHADDLARLMVLAAERGARLLPCAGLDSAPDPFQGFYFAACDEHPTFGELGKMIGSALGRRRTLVVRAGVGMAWVAAGVTELAGQITRRPFVYRLDKLREAAAGDWTCSPERARRELGFQVEVPLADRLRQTVAWYRNEKWL